MGLFDAWRSQVLPVSSEGWRCEKANAVSGTRPVKHLEPLPPFSPSGSIALTPAAALKRLMAVSVPALGPGFMGFAARWSWVHYLWAFAPPAAGKPLRLSTDAEQLAGRRKGLLSEQLGIALGLSLMERYLKLADPRARVTAIDADVAIAAGRAGYFALGRRAKGGIRPDYFVIKERPHGPTEIHCLECKGKSSRLGKSELATAARQLQGVGVVHAGGFHPPPGVVVATSFSETGILSDVFDPEGDEIWTGPAAESDRDRLPSVERSGDRDVVTDVPRFQRLLMEIDDATILEIGRRSTDEQLDRVDLVENEMGVFRGSSQTSPLSPDIEAELFLGVERSVFDAVASRDPGTITAARAAWAAQVRESSAPEEGDVTQVDRGHLSEREFVRVDEERLESYAVDENGLLLDLRIRPRRSFIRFAPETTR